MKMVVFCALGLLLAAFLFVGVVTRVRYRIGSKHLKVLLFGVCIRRLPLLHVDSISKRKGEGLTEYWWSTFRPKHRLLVVRRKRGLFRNFGITPKNRYIFKTDLERALRRVGNPVTSSPREPSDEPEAVSAGADEPVREASVAKELS